MTRAWAFTVPSTSEGGWGPRDGGAVHLPGLCRLQQGGAERATEGDREEGGARSGQRGPDALARTSQMRSQDDPAAWGPPGRHVALRGTTGSRILEAFSSSQNPRDRDGVSLHCRAVQAGLEFGILPPQPPTQLGYRAHHHTRFEFPQSQTSTAQPHTLAFPPGPRGLDEELSAVTWEACCPPQSRSQAHLHRWGN
ncbi:uncharacterized protein LOC104854872 isoform X4 [Fukomys damarensis]|uniref:uncharacterized protein LOC104854872 isoform X4 n=1 Tax=Fukomys damarensis TaxID=885580 RepID=UPI0005402E78|nr:uncharacterized protein LOC104854872 isoform X4 [Fukomys damarensis]